MLPTKKLHRCHREERSVQRSDLPFSEEIGHLGNDASACKGRMRLLKCRYLRAEIATLRYATFAMTIEFLFVWAPIFRGGFTRNDKLIYAVWHTPDAASTIRLLGRVNFVHLGMFGSKYTSWLEIHELARNTRAGKMQAHYKTRFAMIGIRRVQFLGADQRIRYLSKNRIAIWLEWGWPSEEKMSWDRNYFSAKWRDWELRRTIFILRTHHQTELTS